MDEYNKRMEVILSVKYGLSGRFVLNGNNKLKFRIGHLAYMSIEDLKNMIALYDEIIPNEEEFTKYKLMIEK